VRSVLWHDCNQLYFVFLWPVVVLVYLIHQLHNALTQLIEPVKMLIQVCQRLPFGRTFSGSDLT